MSSSVNSDEKKEEKKEEKLKKHLGWIINQKESLSEEETYRIGYETNKLKNTFEKAGFDMRIVNSNDIDIYLTQDDRKSILINGKISKLPEFVLSRTGASTSTYTLAVYRHLEKLDVPVINSSTAIDTVSDKLYSLQILAQNNIPVPKTILLKQPVNVKYVLDRLGLPMIIKLLSGTEGIGVFLVKKLEQLKTYCDLLKAVSPDAKMIFQECLQNSLGKDIRVLVIGGKIIGAMLRTNKNDFRANISCGAQGSLFKLPSSAQYLALSATKCLGLDISGVDLLFDDKDGKKFRVCEVNSAPGFKGFEKATNINVSKQILSYLRIKCSMPPNDDGIDDEDGTDEETLWL